MYWSNTCGKMREIFSEHCNLSMEQYEEICTLFRELVQEINEDAYSDDVEQKIVEMNAVFSFLHKTKELTIEQLKELCEFANTIYAKAYMKPEEGAEE